MARELMLGGQRVFPLKPLATGFAFRHPTIEQALGDLLGRGHRRSAAATRKHRGAVTVQRN